MKKLLLNLLLLTVTSLIYAQPDEWDTYIARHEKGPGSTLVNMSLKQTGPDSTRGWLFAAGVKFKNCTKEGLPAPEAFLSLTRISDSVIAVMERSGKPVLAGTFTYQCERKDYFYVADTSGLQQAVDTMLQQQFPGYTPVFIIRKDPDWEAYQHFLYPNEETLDFIRNQKTVMRLMKAGDINNTPRPVDHFLRFKTEKDREGFIYAAIGRKYTIVSKNTDSLHTYPYRVHLLRTDPITLSVINKITRELKNEAIRFKGIYEAWETIVMRKK